MPLEAVFNFNRSVLLFLLRKLEHTAMFIVRLR